MYLQQNSENISTAVKSFAIGQFNSRKPKDLLRKLSNTDKQEHQLDAANKYIFHIVSLYMFRAGHCPSSGEYDTVHISDWY